MGGWSECDWGSEFDRVGWGGGKFGLLIVGESWLKCPV